MKKSFLITLNVLFFSNLIFSQTPVDKTLTLKDAYKDAFKIGCSVNNAIVQGSDLASQQIVLKQFNSLTPENVLKAETVNPRPGVWNFAHADAYVKFSEEHNMFTVGHTLVWHNQTPDWFFKDDKGNP